MNRVLRYIILSLLVLLPHLGWGQFIWHEDMGRPLGLKFIDIGSTAIFLQQDPLAEKYYNISPYAYCANNPVNFVDPDGSRSKANVNERSCNHIS